MSSNMFRDILDIHSCIDYQLLGCFVVVFLLLSIMKEQMIGILHLSKYNTVVPADIKFT